MPKDGRRDQILINLAQRFKEDRKLIEKNRPTEPENELPFRVPWADQPLTPELAEQFGVILHLRKSLNCSPYLFLKLLSGTKSILLTPSTRRLERL